MARCRVDSSITRTIVDGYEFPLGVYPVEGMKPIEGFTLHFESAESEIPGESDYGERSERFDALDESPDEMSFESGEDEFNPDESSSPGAGGDRRRPGPGERGEGLEPTPWPDRYVFDINIRSSRVESLCRQLFALLPGRVYPIIDVMGNDGYREIDPFIAYDLVGIERFLDAVRRYRSWFFEDGLVGFGAMSEEPFIYLFIDEHKIVTVRVRAEDKDKVEKILRAFDLQEVETIAGADAAVHEHRGVLDAPSNRPDLLSHDEIVEELRDSWGLSLNIDPMTNVDENNQDLGIVVWRCVVRVFDTGGQVRYAEVFVSADSYAAAGDLAISAVQELDPERLPPLPPPSPSPSSAQSDEDVDERDYDILVADRIRPEDLEKIPQLKAHGKPDLLKNAVIEAHWLE